MAPPPPSKSYLLVLDTDSEDEEDDDAFVSHARPRSASPSPVSEDDEAVPAVRKSEQEEVSTPKKKTKSQKKKAKRRKKAKMKKASSSSCRGVSFDTEVRIREYPRTLGATVVPGDGGWPLGMELDPLDEDGIVIDLNEFEQAKQERLQDRWKSLTKTYETEVDLLERAKQSGGLETRQWDYRSGVKNPLFRMLTEEERRAILLQASEESLPEEETTIYKALSSSPTNGRTRSNSVSSCNGLSSSSNIGRPRSNSTSCRSTRSSSVALYNETYDQVLVDHVRNELETTRVHRSQQLGCTCKKLHVYLPPKDGSGGKKAQHRRLKPSKVVQELKKRGAYDESIHTKVSRDELEQLLHDLVEKEPCCKDDCFCARNGMGCQADTCKCWYDSHQVVSGHAPSKHQTSTPTTKVIRERCGNPQSIYVVDIDKIDSIRQETLLVCQPVSDGISCL